MASQCKDTIENIQFREQVEILYKAVSEKNWNVFREFIDTEVEFKAFLPGGVEIRSAREFLDSQTGWFNGTTGKFRYEIKETQVMGELAQSVATVVYKNVAPDGTPFTKNIEISMVFKKVSQKWILIEDVNKVMED